MFSAECDDAKGKFAVKIFDLNGSVEKSIGTPDEQVWRARFDLEIRILETLEHPGVVSLHDKGHLEDGRPFLVMPFMIANLPFEIGRDVKDDRAMERLSPRRRPKPLPLPRLTELLEQIVDALAYVHANGIVHRDLKPNNFLLTRKKSGRVKLCDFGMARWSEQVFDVPGEMIGSRRYVSPGQRRDPSTSDARADVYSLGVIMHRMFTGRLPVGDDISLLSQTDTVPDQWRDLIGACIDAEPDNRPDDALAIQDVLRGF